MHGFLVSAAFLMLMAGSSPLAEGVWGGPHIQLTVDAEGGATVEMDCAHGTLKGPVAVGKDGRFHTAGTYAAEHGGPVREGEEEGRPAVYEGRLAGKSLTLVIKVGEEEVGTFELTHGRGARLTKCL